MKIGIMTFPNMTSYGCSLQMYGLYRAVEQAGAEAEIINYQNPYMKAQRHTGAGKKCFGVTGKLRLMAAKALHVRQIAGFRRFEQKMVKYPVQAFTDKPKLLEVAKRYNGVICGSDQVWNPNITDTDLSYFLDFCDADIRRLAYAPSFGISDFADDFTKKIRAELNRFDSLSVREEDGAHFVESLVDRKVETVLDPTFLLSCEEWTALEKAHPLAKGKYIFCFPVRKSADMIRFGRELAEKRNATLIVAQGNFLHQLRNKDSRLKYALDLSPEEWLNLMHHADCVVTNSFHGAAFAVHYHKDFYLECSSKTNSRLNQLAEICGLQDRVMQAGCAPWDAHIDYSEVEVRLAPARKTSMDYLKKAIWQ